MEFPCRDLYEIISIEDATHEKWTTKGPVEVPVIPEVIKQIEQMFFPNKTQIAEQFKNIIDRMNEI